MKFFHLSDLHIGKRLFGFSLIEDQKYILNEILKLASEQEPDAFLLAGDIYDKAVPSAEAVQLFGHFLNCLAKTDKPIFITSGNHDSAERITFAAEIFNESKIYFSPLPGEKILPVTLKDEYGELDIYLLPFIKPNLVRPYFPDFEISSYQDAVAAVMSGLSVDSERRNILVAHQFVTGALPSDSEELSVGGTEQIDAALFSLFDYVALGHIHRAQQVTAPNIRYCGTPLAYSFSECNHQKSVTLVELLEKGNLKTTALPLTPRRNMRELRGTYMELTDRRNYTGTETEDYLHIILTDEEDVPDAMGKLRSVYPNIMQLSYDNTRTRSAGGNLYETAKAVKKPLEVFDELYTLQNNKPLNDEQREFLASLIDGIWEGKNNETD